MISKEDQQFMIEIIMKTKVKPESITEDEMRKYLLIYKEYEKQRGIYKYQPSPKAELFHRSPAPFRLLHGGNRAGKTFAGASELVRMALCIHPYKQNMKPAEYWVVSETYDVQKEASQMKILELIPPVLIKKKTYRKSEVLDAIILNVVDPMGNSIGESKISFKSSDSGIRAFAGASKRGIWFDEEPPLDVYKECITRIGAGEDLDIWLTMTPIFENRGVGRSIGMSWTHRELYQRQDGTRIACFGLGIEDNPYLTPEQITEQKKKYHGVEYDIRIKGEYRLISGNNVFDNEALEYYANYNKDPITQGFLEVKSSGKVGINEDNTGHLKIWEYPKHSRRYFIGADIGLGTGGDPSCAIVMDDEMNIVAELHGQIPPDRMGYLLRQLGEYYLLPYIGVEANSFGISCIDNLKGKYGKLYFRYKVDERSDRRTKQIGWWTDSKSKPIMIGEFGKALREKALKIPSKQLTDELMTYVIDNTGSMNAQTGCNDDRVIAAMIAMQVRKKHMVVGTDVALEEYIPTNKTTGY